MKGSYRIDLGLLSLTVQTKVSGARRGTPDFRERNLRAGDNLRKTLNSKDKSDTPRLSGNHTKTGIIIHCTNSCCPCLWNVVHSSGHPIYRGHNRTRKGRENGSPGEERHGVASLRGEAKQTQVLQVGKEMADG